MYDKAEKIWKEYEESRNYKSGENLYNIIARNERFYSSDQWKGVRDGNLPLTTLNFLEQLVDVKVSTIMANQLTIHRKPDELSADNPMVSLAAKAFQESDKKNWERLKMDTLNENVLLDSAISGLGVSYWWWDEDIITGNEFLTKGDFKGEIIDSINLYVSNPNEADIQKQDWTMLALRKTVKQIKDMAKKYGVPENEIEMIQGDEDTVYEGFDKAQNEQDRTSNQATLLLKLWKEKKKVFFCYSTKQVHLKTETTELDRYPIAILPWKLRKRFIYGNAEITHIIANQQHVNKMEAMRQLAAQLVAIPKVGYNKNMIAGITNTVGGILPIDAAPGEDIGKALHYWQPTQMTMDVDKSIESTITKTREFKGINDNVIGASTPENTSAILAQQKAAGVPLESIKRRFYQYLEDVALIWLDFYKNKYKLTRKLKTEDGEVIEFKGSDLKNVDLRTAIDVGASSQYNEIISVQVLDNLLASGHITIVEYLERYPKNIIPDQEKLLEDKQNQLGMMEQQKVMQSEQAQVEQDSAQQEKTQQYEQMADFMEKLPKNAQEALMRLPPESQEQEIMKLMQQSVRQSVK